MTESDGKDGSETLSLKGRVPADGGDLAEILSANVRERVLCHCVRYCLPLHITSSPPRLALVKASMAAAA